LVKKTVTAIWWYYLWLPIIRLHYKLALIPFYYTVCRGLGSSSPH